MSTLKNHFDDLYRAIKGINENGHVDQADEFSAMAELQDAIHQARKTFERTKDMDKEHD